MRRVFKRWICRALIGTLLFAQMAVAAYACPGLSSALGHALNDSVAAMNAMATTAPEDQAVASDDDAAPKTMDCEHMGAATDKASPNLCVQHCQQGQQSDQASTVTVPLVFLTSLYTLAPPSETAPRLPFPGAQPGVFAAVSPPHSILHCCLRT